MPDCEIITADFPESRNCYWRLLWHYQVDYDLMFRFGHISDTAIHHFGIEDPLKNFDELLASRWYKCYGAVTCRLRIDRGGPWLQFYDPYARLKTTDFRDRALLNLAVARWHGEDIYPYFMDRLIEIDGDFSTLLEKGL